MPKSDPKRFTQVDVFTGEEFKSRVENHYEVVDPVPVAPRVEMARPTVRQRVENLLNRGIDPLARYVGSEGLDFDVPDDPEAPLTSSEQSYIDIVAAELAEAAPFPDEGMPRPAPQNASSASPASPQAPPSTGEGVASPPSQPPFG